MKKLLTKIFLITIICSYNSIANAATQQFTVDAVGTLDVTTSDALLSSSMDDADGHLDSDLRVDFAINTNVLGPIYGLKLSAFTSTLNGDAKALFSTSSGETDNATAKVIFAAQGGAIQEDCASSQCVQNCCNSGLCNCDDNLNVVSYPVTITIDNEGRLEYSSSEQYFDVILNLDASNVANPTNLSLILNRDCCSGTYSSPDTSDSVDVEGDYEVNIMLSGTPSLSSGG